MRDDCFDHFSMLFIWCKIHHDISGRKHFLIGANRETIFGCVEVGLALFLNRSRAEGIGYVEAGVAHVEALVEALGATAHNHNL